jgi:hypothetical protein
MPPHVEQVVAGAKYTVVLHAAEFIVHLDPDLANRLAYDLTEAALEPDTCDWDGCSNYVAAVGVEHCARHLADADDTPDYAQEAGA